MSVTTLPALTPRDRSVLRAVAAGRCSRPGPSSLTVDGMALADQFAGLRLLDAGLIDQLHLFVHPATAGSGLRLFDEGAPDRHFKLVSATPFATGVIHLTYEPDPNPPTGGYEEAAERLPQD